MPKYLFIFLLISTFALAKDIDLYKQGEILYAQKGCNGCHGVHGEGMHEYPVIMNKPKWYLVKKMKFYRGKKGVMRQTAQIMIPFAEFLSDEEISYLTHYLSLYKEDMNAPKYDIEYESWGDGGS
ncbi:cytochrome c [Sulfurimonas sp. MAG313]|nr:c-type cytochrome [Sulfurimonas sp. MAG313]MDF1879994.1 cytochrome c [Sulfurimonas sp. MAG313]